MELAGVTVGTQLPPIAIAPITRETLALFGTASGDLNPIHLDPAVARSAGLEDVFAQGMLSMAYLGRLLTDWAPQESLRMFEVRFVAITPLHAAPRLTGHVVSIDTDVETLATVEVAATLADGTPTLTGTAVLAIG